MTLTLTAKENRLHNTVALPTCDDWQLLIDSPVVLTLVVDKLNAVLVLVLKKAKAGKYKTWGHMARDLTTKLHPIHKRYSRVGIYDSEGKQTMARFFAVNYDTSIYDFIRF